LPTAKSFLTSAAADLKEKRGKARALLSSRAKDYILKRVRATKGEVLSGEKMAQLEAVRKQH
jgi:hypothetical protein